MRSLIPGCPGAFSTRGVGKLRFAIASAGLVLTMTAAGLSIAAAPGARKPDPPSPAPRPEGTYPFNFDVLQADAKRLAAKPYTPRSSALSADLDKLSPEQYHAILFDRNAAIWRKEGLPFRLELLRAGFNQRTAPVTVSTVEAGLAKDLIATPAMFAMGAVAQHAGGQVSLPLSGFRLVGHINSKKVWDEFLVFQGASYFRAVAKNLLYGLSARGLAINTAEGAGEEFPAFTHFWIERPAPRAESIVIDALLESDSTTGAYRFTVTPGVETVMDVEFTLFPRTDVRVVGIAPLTSMFLFDETNRGRLDDYRPEVQAIRFCLRLTHSSYVLLALGACDDMSVQPKQKVYSPLVGPARTPLDTVEFLESPTPPPNVTLALLEPGAGPLWYLCALPVIPSWETGARVRSYVQRGFPSPALLSQRS